MAVRVPSPTVNIYAFAILVGTTPALFRFTVHNALPLRNFLQKLGHSHAIGFRGGASVLHQRNQFRTWASVAVRSNVYLKTRAIVCSRAWGNAELFLASPFNCCSVVVGDVRSTQQPTAAGTVSCPVWLLDVMI